MEDLQGGALALEHRYDIGRSSGTIGFCSVYKGVQHPFGREVSILVFDVLAESGADDELVARIRGSAEAYARLEHDGIVRAIDVGELDMNLPFVVVDRASGVRLASHFDSVGTMTPAETATLLERLAQIVDAAHDQGMVHGSLAPAWVHVDPDDLMDVEVEHWGLGLSVPEMRSMDDAYMGFDAVCALAPEMFDEDGAPTIAGDVYALAAIAFRAIAGIHPFFDDVSDTSEGLLRLQREEPPSLEEFGIEPGVAEVVARGLASDPDERWESAGAFAGALVRAIAPPPEAQDEDDIQAADDIPEQRRPRPEPELSGENEWSDPNAPSPKGGLLAIAVALIVITNAGWFMLQPTVDESQTDGVATDVLPDGVHLYSEPTGAKITEVTPDGEKELGETPMVIDPRIRDDETLELKLTRRGHGIVRVDIRRGETGNEIVVDLPPAE